MSNGLRVVAKWRLLIAACLLPFGLASCRVTPESVTHSRATYDYDRLEIIYRAHLAEGVLLQAAHFPSIPDPGLLEPSETGIVTASAKIDSARSISAATSESVDSELNWSVAELRVQYPHPDKREGYARVTLQWQPIDYGQVFEQRSLKAALEEGVEIRKARRETRRDRWFWERSHPSEDGATFVEFDLPRPELDGLMRELNSHGFFSHELLPRDVAASEQASQLEVRLDRRWTSRAWHYEPALDALTTRVYEQGRTNIANDLPPTDSPAGRNPLHWLSMKSLMQNER